ncbi:MAG: amino acid permease, partial [Planctomycetes bacterium]|nr:amino acid permease [Planctomycetota bacterium]
MATARPLKRIIGTPTALLLGMGVAIGSGIFRTPGEVAGYLQSPWIIMLAWLLGGSVTLAQGMITAELSTRFPKAGGEYVYLREAFGEFAAFFFGWSYTIFILGGAAATIGRAFGDFGCDLFAISVDSNPH